MSESRPERRKVEFIESYWTGGRLGGDYEWNDNHGELIRCRDCEYFKVNKSMRWCDKINRFTAEYQYCSWAVKKDDN